MKGECLCQAVRFEIDGAMPNLYQCHCSLCRRVTGSGASAATLVAAENFRWLSGEGEIRSYQKPSGYRSDFCSVCGSPVPNRLRDRELVWVPAGLLQGEIGSRVAVHLHLSSRTGWEQEAAECVRLEGGPDSLEALHKLLY